MSQPLDQPSDAPAADAVVQSTGETSGLKQPSPSVDQQPQSPVQQPSSEPMSVDQPTVEQSSTVKSSNEEPTDEQPSTEQPSTEQPSTEQPSAEQDTPMQENRAPAGDSTLGANKRQSSHDGDDDGEERAAKRVKEDHASDIVPAQSASSPHPATSNAQSSMPRESSVSAASPQATTQESPASRAQELPTPQPQNQSLPNGEAPAIYVPGSFQPEHREPFGPTTPITGQQCRSLLAIVKQVKKTREAGPFNSPVDPIAFNIPHYANIIKRPMDLSTVETKLNASNPAPPKDKSRPVKKDMSLGTYANVQEVVEDVRQIWNNTRIFNGPQHAVSLNANKLDDMFETAIQKAKLGEETSARRASISHAPAIKQQISDEHGENSRPRREVHPPTPKDSAWVAEQSSSKRKAGRPTEEDKIAAVRKLLDELTYRKQYMDIVAAFLYPVDPVALNIPDYLHIIKQPMDISTIQSRIAQHQYSTAQQIYNDFKLMLNNCFTYNPPGTPVHEVGRQLERVWQEKWNGNPVLHARQDAPESEDEFPGVDVEHEIRMLEKQISDMTSRLDRLRAYRTRNQEKARNKASSATKTKTAPSGTSSSKPPKKSAPKAAAANKPKKQANGNAHSKKANFNYDDEEDDEPEATPAVTLAQKQQLADKIGEVDHNTLQSALEIISASTSVGDGNDEIELDIDALPSHTVYQLYNLVVLGYPNGKAPKKKKAPANRAGAGGAASSRRAGAGGGGQRRNSKQNGHETDRIRALEAQLASLEGQPGGNDNDDDNSSVAYSEEDSDED